MKKTFLLAVLIIGAAVVLCSGLKRSPGGVSQVQAPPAAAQNTPQAAPEGLFAEGKKLVEANCGDCAGASREALELALQHLSSALEAGHTDQSQSLALLHEAYNTLAFVFAEPDSQEQADLLRKRDEILNRRLELNPDSTEVLFDYAASINDLKEQQAVSRHILSLDPTHAGARFLLSVALLEQGAAKAGLKEMRRAYRAAEGLQALAYGKRLVAVLREQGLPEEASQIERELRTRY